MSAISGVNGQPVVPNAVAPIAGKPVDPRLWKSAQNFEEIFLSQFVRTMRTSEIKGGLLKESAGRATFDAMFSEAIGREMARRGTMGLTDHIYRKLGGQYTRPDLKTEAPIHLDNTVKNEPEKNDVL